MIMNVEPQAAEIDQVPVQNHLYHIDQVAYEEAGESLEFMVWRRLCWTGDCRLCKANPDAKPPAPVNVRSINTIYNAIRRCAKRDDFILANMSILEVIFRILLRNSNEPMRLLDIAQTIEEEWVAVLAMKSVAPATIQRMLDNPNQYKIRRASEPE